MAPYIISVEGNIGTGKSTFVELLEKQIPDAIFLQEPVKEWNDVKDHTNETMLQKFYKNQTRYSFAFQMMAYISRLALLKKTVKENPNTVVEDVDTVNPATSASPPSALITDAPSTLN